MSDDRLLQKSTYIYESSSGLPCKIRSLYVQSIEHAAVNCFVTVAAAGGSKASVAKTAETGRDVGEDGSATMFQGAWSLVRAQQGEPNMNMSLNCNSSWGSYLFVGKCDISVFNISSTM